MRIAAIIIAMALASCSSTTGTNSVVLSSLGIDYAGYVPLEELSLVTSATIFDPAADARVQKDWRTLSKEEQLLNLSLLESEVTIYSRDRDGRLSYLSNSATGSKGQYTVIIDFSRYRTDEIFNSNGTNLGKGKVGVGLRLRADILTKKSGINISGILPFAFAYNDNQIEGRISALTIGLVAPDISKYFITQTSLDRSSLEKAIEAFGSIRVVMDSEATQFEPYLLALSRIKEEDFDAAIAAATDKDVDEALRNGTF